MHNALKGVTYWWSVIQNVLMKAFIKHKILECDIEVMY